MPFYQILQTIQVLKWFRPLPCIKKQLEFINLYHIPLNRVADSFEFGPNTLPNPDPISNSDPDSTIGLFRKLASKC